MCNVRIVKARRDRQSIDWLPQGCFDADEQSVDGVVFQNIAMNLRTDSSSRIVKAVRVGRYRLRGRIRDSVVCDRWTRFDKVNWRKDRLSRTDEGKTSTKFDVCLVDVV